VAERDVGQPGKVAELEEAVEHRLAQVEVDEQDSRAALHEARREVRGHRALAHAALSARHGDRAHPRAGERREVFARLAAGRGTAAAPGGWDELEFGHRCALLGSGRPASGRSAGQIASRVPGGRGRSGIAGKGRKGLSAAGLVRAVDAGTGVRAALLSAAGRAN
jgi:hypothetical protein